MKTLAMNRLSSLSCLLAVGAFSLSLPAMAHADTVAVLATDSVYAAGAYAGAAPSFGATAPTLLGVNSGATYVTFSVTGTVTVNGGTYNDADGAGSVQGETNYGYQSLSGISASTAGFVAGVFVGPGGPSGTAPAALDFTNGGTQFSSLSPLLNQVFFVGDGLTGDGTGSVQQFVIPTGATGLYLGLTDACGYVGTPSCYGDNSGTFNVTYNEAGAVVPPPPSAVPEPSSLMLLGTGALGAASAARRRWMKR